MVAKSVEQAVRAAIKAEIGDDETITFKQKNQLSLKYGLITPIIPAEELAYWEMREKVARACDILGGRYAR
jgi:hypothetical protein